MSPLHPDLHFLGYMPSSGSCISSLWGTAIRFPYVQKFAFPLAMYENFIFFNPYQHYACGTLKSPTQCLKWPSIMPWRRNSRVKSVFPSMWKHLWTSSGEPYPKAFPTLSQLVSAIVYSRGRILHGEDLNPEWDNKTWFSLKTRNSTVSIFLFLYLFLFQKHFLSYILLSEAIQTKKDKHHMSSFTCGGSS